MTKKEAITVPPLLFMFEEILSGGTRGVCFHDSKDWRQSQWFLKLLWVDVFIKDNRIRVIKVEPSDDKTFHFHYCVATAAGIKWWLGQYTFLIADRQSALESLLTDDPGHYGNNLPGIGVGGELRYDLKWNRNLAKAAMVAIEEGYFELASFYFYSRTGEKSFRVKLTEKGLKFFSSIERVQEVF